MVSRRSGAAALVIVAAAAWWAWRAGAGPEPAAKVVVAAPAVAIGEGPTGRRVPAIDRRDGRWAAIAGTVRDPQGRPVAGAQVCALALSERLAVSDTRTPSCARSERDGGYRIEGLFGVRHRVSAGAPGFVPVWFGRGEGAARREWVDLRAGMEVRGVDLTLEGGGVEIFGVVKDLSGGAIEGATVSGGGLMMGSGIAVTSSGPEGEFSLWVRPGRTRTWAQADGYAPSPGEEGAAPGHRFELFLTPESVIVGKVVRAGDGSPVAGAELRADAASAALTFTDAAGRFRLDGLLPGVYKPRAEADDALGMADAAVVLGLGETSDEVLITAHPAVHVEGTLVIAGGDSCADGWVTLQDSERGRSGRGQTEGDGLVRVRGLLAGTYAVSVGCNGFIPAESYAPVVVGATPVGGLRWELTRGRSIRGVVVDASGQPVANISVGARTVSDPARPRAQTTNPNNIRPDPQGRFELPGLLPGSYEVFAYNTVTPRAVPDAPLAVTLPEGQDLEGVRIELPASAELRGQVRDAQGRAVARVQMHVVAGLRPQQLPVDDRGDVVFAHVPVGTHRVYASREGVPLRAPGTGDDDLQGEMVELRAGAVAMVKLVVEADAGRIAGVVRDADGGVVTDAFITARRESESAAAAPGDAAIRRFRGGGDAPLLTDADGRFVVAGLRPGKYTLRAERRGGGEAQLEHVALGSDAVLTIAETGGLAGVVLRPGGGAPEEFTATLRDRKTGYRRSDNFFRTGGAWRFPELPGGEYELVVSAGEGTGTLTTTLAPGESRGELRVELLGKVTVRGTVVDLEGQPVAGVAVRIGVGGFGGEAGDGRHISDAAGRFEVVRAPVGVVTIAVDPGAGAPVMGSLTTTQLEGTGGVIKLAPIRLAPRRLKSGEVSGDLGYSVKQQEPGADPLQARQIVAVVRPGGPAAAAGLQVGDEILTVDGHDVTGGNSPLHMLLRGVPVGAVLRLGLARGVIVEIAAQRRI